MTSTVVVAVGSVILVFAVMLTGVAGLFAYLERTKSVGSAPGKALELRVASLEVTVQGLPSLWEEERRRVERSADASRKARDSAEKKLALIEEYEEPDPQLQLVDEGGGSEDGVQQLRQNLGVSDDSNLMERAKAVGWPWLGN